MASEHQSENDSEQVSDVNRTAGPTLAQRTYLERGIGQPGGKLPLFGHDGRQINHQTIRSCIANGWAEPWFNNPIKPDWLVCRLTVLGYHAVGAEPPEGGVSGPD